MILLSVSDFQFEEWDGKRLTKQNNFRIALSFKRDAGEKQ